MASPSQPATAAREKVLSTFELIEHILLHLPLRQLLLAQRVNKAFFSVVKESPDIGRALFIRPSAGLVHDKPDAQCPILWNTMDGSKVARPIINPFFPVQRIPFLPSILRDGTHQALKAHGHDSMFLKVSTDPVQSFACWRQIPSTIHKTDSRDKMLITHPPIGRFAIKDGYQAYDGPGSVIGREDKGTTYGQLLRYCSLIWPEKLLDDKRRMQASQRSDPKLWPAIYEVRGCISWRRFARDVNTITGFEMLENLDSDQAKLGTELYDPTSDPYNPWTAV